MRHEESAMICGSVPIRYGLITWAAIKSIVALCFQVYLYLSIKYLFITKLKQYDAVLLGILVLLQVALMVDICMSITLIVGECKKNYKLVTAYFRYAVYAVITSIFIIFVYTVYELIVLYGDEDNAPWKELRTFDFADVVKLATICTIYVLFEVLVLAQLLWKEVNSLRSQRWLNCKDDATMAESWGEDLTE